MQHAWLQTRDDIKREKKKSKFQDRLTFILKNRCRCLLTNLLTWTWTLDRKLWEMLSIYLSTIPAFWETGILIGWRHGWWWERCAAWLEEGSGWRHDDVHGWSGGSQRQSPPPRPSHRKKLPPPVQGSPLALKNIFVFFPEGSTFSWTKWQLNLLSYCRPWFFGTLDTSMQCALCSLVKPKFAKAGHLT